MYKSNFKRELVELYSMFFCLMASYGQKETFTKEFIDLLKLYNIDLGLTPEELRKVLVRTAEQCPGVHIVSFIFADTFLKNLQ